jgi:hypothetical protein
LTGSTIGDVIERVVRDGEPDRNIVCNEVYLSNIIITQALEDLYNQVYKFTQSPEMLQQ